MVLTGSIFKIDSQIIMKDQLMYHKLVFYIGAAYFKIICLLNYSKPLFSIISFIFSKVDLQTTS